MHLDCGSILEISVLQDSTVFHLDDLNGHSERALLLVGYESYRVPWKFSMQCLDRCC